MPLVGKLLRFYKDMYIAQHTTGLDFRMVWERMAALSSFLYSNMERKDVAAIGVKFGGLVVECTYKGKDCTENDFIHHLHPSLLNCFTFRLNRSTESTQTVPQVGPHNGLSLVLRSEANNNYLYENLDKQQNVDSVKLTVHPPGTLPALTNKGINLEPGKSTSVSLMMQTYDRLGSPYTECKNRGIFELQSHTYLSTSDVCQERCIIQAIQKECNCTSTLVEDLTQTSEYNYCPKVEDNFDPIQFYNRTLCEIDYVQGAKNMECNDCVWDCQEIDYDTQIAYSAWPHETKVHYFIHNHVLSYNRNYFEYPKPCTDPIKSYYTILLNKANISHDVCPSIENNVTDKRLPFSFLTLANTIRDSTDMFAYARPDFTDVFKYEMDVPISYYSMKTAEELNAKWVKESFYRVNIYFRQSAVQQHSQLASFSFADLWSNIGGILGLWLGCSIMTIIEICSLIMKSLYNGCVKDSMGSKKKSVRKVGNGPCSDE